MWKIKFTKLISINEYGIRFRKKIVKATILKWSEETVDKC